MAKKAKQARQQKRKGPVDGRKRSDRGAVGKGRVAAADQSRRRAADAAQSRPSPAEGVPVDGGPEFTVVGVGASAGGLEAFSQLLRALPADANLAVVYVQHLAPHYESSLAALLGETTSMPVAQVTDRMLIKPGGVYVIPPNAFLTIASGRFRLSPRPEGRSQYCPVDHFFRSLAEYAQQQSVAVILSGTNSDGAAGLREIKAVGGITFAQEPGTAKFDGMPRAAAATGAVDKVLPPGAIAEELARIARHPLLRSARARIAEAEVAISDNDWQRVFTLLHGASGVDFTHYKQPTLRRRLQRRMVLHKSTNIEHYLRYLQQNPAEVTALYQDILIHVTRFFREPESYDFLAGHVFPQIMRGRRPADQPVRMWVPGCSTGEEAYSIAMSLLEFLGDDATDAPVQVFATDVSESAVAQARLGTYPESIAVDVSPERLRRFFSKVDGSYRIGKRVRDAVIFARQDLTRDPPFSKLDLIVCRNVLIYLGPVLQKKLMNVFHYALKATGFLMLGASETIGPHSDLFALTDKRHKVYSKKVSGVRMDMNFPAGEYASERAEAIPKRAEGARAGSTVLNEANRMILGKYAPPGVIVDEDLQIIQFRGQTSPFLEPAPGEASLNLLKMAREGLLFSLRSAIGDARKSGAVVRRTGLRVKHGGRILDVNLEILPLVVAGDERHFLVFFEEVGGKKEPSGAWESARGKKLPTGRGPKASAEAAPISKGKSTERFVRLEQELAASREYLQSIIQDLEAANEELQSANEEILSSNEELQSTNEELDTAKEELQSTNEELNTVNEELQGRNEELSRANGDLLNLLSSVQIAVVMVTSDLRIRRFTPMAEKVLNLIPTDIGRPISDIKPNIDLPDLEKLIAQAMDSVTPIERQVRDRQGTTYLVRIRPYKSVENKIDGAVLALLDMEMARRQERAGPDIKLMLDGLLAVASEPMLVLDGQMRVLLANRPFSELFNTAGQTVIGRSVYDLGEGRWKIPALRDLLERALQEEIHVADFSVEQSVDGPDGAKWQINAHRIRREGGEPDLVLLSINPKSESKARN